MRHPLLFAILAIFLAPLPAAESSLTLEASTDREVYREAARNEIYVAAWLRGGELPASAAGPARNLAFVIDRSGSMAGEPIAALREAVSAGLSSLAARDLAAVVAFGSEVETLIEARTRAEIGDPVALLARLEPAGGAALYDALNQGAAQLRRHAAPSTINHLILVTDGPPTKGPREFADFVRLAEAFAIEGITLSTIGLGEEFDEDMLSAMARHGHGRFRYAREPAALMDVLQAELAWNPIVVGHDAVLSFEFPRTSFALEPHGSWPATVTARDVSFRFPRLYAAHDFGVLASIELEAGAARVFLPNVATVRLQWKTADGVAHELTRTVPAHFTNDIIAIRKSANAGPMRTAVRIMIGESLQEAIEHLDANDARRALRAVRTARTEAYDLNLDLADPAIAESIRQLDGWLADLRDRSLTPADRKILRSGLLNRFDPPHPEDEAK